MMKVFYYYYYLFYKKVLRDNDPHFLTTLVLSFSFSLLINAPVDIVVANLFGKSIGKWGMISVLAAIIVWFYIYFQKTGKSKNIVRERPMFFKSHTLSILLTLAFFLITTSFLFWGPIYIKSILESN